MENLWSKLDTGLQQLYSNYLSIQKEGKQNVGWIHPALREDNTQIPVSLIYSNNLASIEAAGFTVRKDKGDGNAIGLVDLKTLEQVAANPSVIELRYGLERTLNLDTSVIEITARKAASGAAPFIWDVDRSTGVFAGSTGENVVIGVIDTGIDFTHKNFFKNTTPETRILRIWDMGLTKTGTEKSPDVALLDGADTYGVEYTDAMINDVIQKKAGAKPVRHKDCIGHGTHVASTAAGDGREPSFLGVKGFDFVGVAPKASLIIVKFLGLTTPPAVAGPDQRLKDAFSYILKTAAALNGGAGLPVVINCSFGSDLGSHDGLEPNEQEVSKLFDNVAGKACVFAAGNASGKRHHAIITMPAGGSIDVPFDLSDKRTATKDKDTCVEKTNTVVAFLDFWYKDISPGTLKASLQVPGGAFTAAVNLDDPELKGTFDGGKSFSITHTKQPPRPRPGAVATNVIRNNLTIAITAKDDVHKSGTYTVRLEAPPNTIVHVWCGQVKRQIFKVNDPLPAAVAPNINVTDQNTISGESCLPNIITAAAYDDTTGKMTSFSSQGPVVDYSAAAAGPIAEKPDLAAPGFEITAAKSATGEFPPDIIKRMLGQFYIQFNGTSMSAPHITGVVALMLQKNKNLKSNDILIKLKAGARAFLPAVPPASGGKGKTGAKQTFDSV